MTLSELMPLDALKRDSLAKYERVRQTMITKLAQKFEVDQTERA